VRHGAVLWKCRCGVRLGVWRRGELDVDVAGVAWLRVSPPTPSFFSSPVNGGGEGRGGEGGGGGYILAVCKGCGRRNLWAYQAHLER